MRFYFPKIDEVRQIEQDRRTLQEGLERAQRIIDETLALIANAEADATPAWPEHNAEAGEHDPDRNRELVEEFAGELEAGQALAAVAQAKRRPVGSHRTRQGFRTEKCVGDLLVRS